MMCLELLDRSDEDMDEEDIPRDPNIPGVYITDNGGDNDVNTKLKPDRKQQANTDTTEIGMKLDEMSDIKPCMNVRSNETVSKSKEKMMCLELVNRSDE
ncbi:hypothetical protein SNE40_021433 [Patella caerulea]|uniref:Uncharacterized protein n=1 Tax=Patella caerulea TaxID=87958 RepID=A0AAN8FZI6_PATCE